MLSEEVSSKHHSLAAGHDLEIQREMRPAVFPPRLKHANSNAFLFSSGVALPRMRSFHRSVWAEDGHHQHFPVGGRRGNFMGTHLCFGPLARPHIIQHLEASYHVKTRITALTVQGTRAHVPVTVLWLGYPRGLESIYTRWP